MAKRYYVKVDFTIDGKIDAFHFDTLDMETGYHSTITHHINDPTGFYKSNGPCFGSEGYPSNISEIEKAMRFNRVSTIIYQELGKVAQILSNQNQP